MCLRKVYVRDVIRRGIGNYFDCGRCPSCRQKLANRRARKIKNHEQTFSTPYFITLTYSNDFIPYARREDIEEAISEWYHNDEVAEIPIYRDAKAYYNRGERKVRYGRVQIGSVPYSLKSTHLPTDTLVGIRTLIRRNPDTYHYEPNKISVSYNADATNFIKRLRQNLYRLTGVRQKITYYKAPEYGPTTQRFHFHFIVWLPKTFSPLEVPSFIRAAWPFSDFDNYEVKDYCSPMSDAAAYVASYVNNDASVSELLQAVFKLRSSHSLGFGFNERLFGLQEIINQFKQGLFGYDTVYTNKKGECRQLFILYPKYVINRYFPKPKGYGRLTRSSVYNAFLHPAQYFAITPSVCSTTPSGLELHQSSLVDRYGCSVLFTEKESRYLQNKVLKTYYRYYFPLGFSYENYVNFVLDYHDARSTFLYKQSQSHHFVLDNLYQFFNLSNLLTSVRNDTVTYCLNRYGITDFDPNHFPSEISDERRLLDTYYNKIKQKKINAV